VEQDRLVYSLCAKNRVEKLNLQRIKQIISTHFIGNNEAIKKHLAICLEKYLKTSKSI
jgi:hypothetical protein